ncbi:MAG: hypothetical protein ACYDCQ_16865 [Dehalococcoidia bacterium]
MQDSSGDRSLVRRAEESYFELFRAMARLSPEGAIAEADGLVLIASGKPLPFFNAAVATRWPENPAATLKRAADFYAARGLRYMLNAIGPIAEVLGPLALAAGMEPHESTRMLLAPLIGQPQLVPGLEIRAVDDLASLRQYNATMTTGFESDLDWAGEAMLQSDTLVRVPDLTHYLGLVGGEPVATAMRFSVSRIAHVANVSTIPDLGSRARRPRRGLHCQLPTGERDGLRHLSTHGLPAREHASDVVVDGVTEADRNLLRLSRQQTTRS